MVIPASAAAIDCSISATRTLEISRANVFLRAKLNYSVELCEAVRRAQLQQFGAEQSLPAQQSFKEQCS
eukprot:11767-Heterococcus_DN1.PRE.2